MRSLSRNVRFHLSACSVFAIAIGVPSFAADKALSPEHAVKLERGLKLFDDRVGKLLTARCIECHSGSMLEGALDLSTRAGLLKGGERGPAVLIGRSADSLLTKLVRQSQEPHMPAEGEPLTELDCKVLADWIDCGAPYSVSLGGNAVADDWTRRRVTEEDGNHWAFQPLHSGPVPNFSDSSKNAVDAFLSRAQMEHGVTPSSLADRRTLIRRLCLDLLGIPPTPEEVDAFVEDASA
ncbi:MAG: hypothetical protein B7Z55_12235, partial [Planctomycetales bacterium 12-60-4]